MAGTLFAIALALVASDCPTAALPVSHVNRPVATAKIAGEFSLEQASNAVRRFAMNRRFAVQEVIAAPRGMIEFSTMLFRDDLRVSVSKLRGESLEIAAYPLCACEATRMFGLQEAADAAVADMRAELTQR
jgi:hypothetical protein